MEGSDMGERVSQQTREELVAALVERYAGSGRDDKARILDKFERITRYHRKHAIRRLGRLSVAALDGGDASVDGTRKPRERTYDEARSSLPSTALVSDPASLQQATPVTRDRAGVRAKSRDIAERRVPRVATLTRVG
jgi:hypothetical protein